MNTDPVQRTVNSDTEPQRTDFHGLLTFDEHEPQRTEPQRTEPQRESSYVPEQSAHESEAVAERIAHAHAVFRRNLVAFDEWYRATSQRSLDDERAVQRSYLDLISRERDPHRVRALHNEYTERVEAIHRNYRRTVDEARARLLQQYVRLRDLEQQHRAVRH